MANIRRVFVLLAVFVCFFKLQQKIAGGDSKLTGYVIFSLSHRVVRHGCCLRVHTRIVCGCPSSRLMVTFRPSLSTTILLLLSGDIESNPGPIESSSVQRESTPGTTDSSSIERKPIPDTTDSSSVEREPIPDTTDSSSVEREPTPGTTDSSSAIQRESNPGPNSKQRGNKDGITCESICIKLTMFFCAQA